MVADQLGMGLLLKRVTHSQRRDDLCGRCWIKMISGEPQLLGIDLGRTATSENRNLPHIHTKVLLLHNADLAFLREPIEVLGSMIAVIMEPYPFKSLSSIHDADGNHRKYFPDDAFVLLHKLV